MIKLPKGWTGISELKYASFIKRTLVKKNISVKFDRGRTLSD